MMMVDAIPRSQRKTSKIMVRVAKVFLTGSVNFYFQFSLLNSLPKAMRGPRTSMVDAVYEPMAWTKDPEKPYFG